MRALSKVKLLRPPTSDAQLSAMRTTIKDGAADRPGVYRMYSADGEIVYVGKSKRVRSRLLSYFRCSFPEDKGARILREATTQAGLKVYGGKNAPYIWVKTPAGLTSWEMFDRMLKDLNVVITPGSGFGSEGEGYFRISAFNSRENAEEVARRLRG